jgi:CO/xanthine dehydrogenase Mo-binding subunit
VAMVLSKKSGRPVKMQHTREDVFEGTGPASGMSATLKVGVTKEGKITAVQGAYNFQAGAYPGSPVGRACTFTFSSYKIPNADIKGLDVVSNRPNVTAYRGPGAPQGNYVFESMLDEIADQLGMDPWELRRRNLIAPDEPTIYGAKIGEAGLEECIAAVENHPNAKVPLGPNQGRGIAVGYWGNAGGESSAQLHINEDGTALVITGHPDIGGSRASMVNIAAEMLGIDYRKVRAQIGDTNNIGISGVTGGSRVTFAAAMAVNQATEQVIKTLRGRAAQIWGWPERRRIRAADAGATGSQGRIDRWPNHRGRLAERHWPYGRVWRAHGRCRGRQRNRCCENLALYGLPGRWPRNSSGLRRRPNPGWCRPGYRLGAQRRVRLYSRWPGR